MPPVKPHEYVLSGAGGGWVVTIKHMGACEVLQRGSGRPIAAPEDALEEIPENIFILHCLVCGDAIGVYRDTPPVCSTCRE